MEHHPFTSLSFLIHPLSCYVFIIDSIVCCGFFFLKNCFGIFRVSFMLCYLEMLFNTLTFSVRCGRRY